MWYNLDLIKAAGFSAPPKTWKEFEEQCLAITAKTGKKGYAYIRSRHRPLTAGSTAVASSS